MRRQLRIRSRPNPMSPPRKPSHSRGCDKPDRASDWLAPRNGYLLFELRRDPWVLVEKMNRACAGSPEVLPSSAQFPRGMQGGIRCARTQIGVLIEPKVRWYETPASCLTPGQLVRDSASGVRVRLGRHRRGSAFLQRDSGPSDGPGSAFGGPDGFSHRETS